MTRYIQVLILIFCIVGCKRATCEDDNVHDYLKGNWELIEKRKFYENVPISYCDSINNRITIYSNKDSFWNFCSSSGGINKRKVKFYHIGGPDYCEPRLKYHEVSGDDIFDVSGNISNGNISISYRYQTNIDTLYHLTFQKY